MTVKLLPTTKELMFRAWVAGVTNALTEEYPRFKPFEDLERADFNEWLTKENLE